MSAEKSLSIGFNMEQGIGFSENTGMWPTPEENGGAIKIVDNDNLTRVLVLDYKTGLFFDVTYGLHSNEPKLFTDQTDMQGEGYNIEPSVVFKEDRGEFEKFKIESLANYVYVRPDDEEVGFLEDTAFELSVSVDGKVGQTTATAKDIEDGEVVFDRKVEGKRIQPSFSSNKSGFSLVGRQQDYIAKDLTFFTPEKRINTEGDHQQTLISNTKHWFTRSKTPLKDRVGTMDENPVVYAVFGGPDGKENSGVVTEYALFSKTLGGIGASHVMVWLYEPELFNTKIIGADMVKIKTDKYDVWSLWYGPLTQASLLFEVALMFDLRFLNSLSDSCIDYYYNDVIQNNGDNVCPLW